MEEALVPEDALAKMTKRVRVVCVPVNHINHIPRDSVLDDLPAALVYVAFAGAHYLGGPSFPSEELALYPLTGCVRGCSANLCASFDGSANGAPAPWC